MNATLAPRRTLGPSVAKFFERRLRFTEGPKIGRPFILEPWQREDLDLIYEVDADDLPVWQTTLLGIARGSGKSPLTAGTGLWELASRRDKPNVYGAAGARDQARIIQDFANGFVRTGPLVDYLDAKANWIKAPRTGGIMRILSADGDLQHGLNVSAALIDELHVFKTQKQRELYFALATALKRPDSVMRTITTAGYDKQTLLGEQYDAALKFPDVVVTNDGCKIIAKDAETRTLMIWYGLPDDADPLDEDLWRLVNPASWVDLAYLRRQSKKLPLNVFRRLHLNQWTESEDRWLPVGAWDACVEPGMRIEDGAEVCVGVDFSRSKDTTAVVVVAVGDVRRAQARILTPARDGSKIPIADVEALLWEHAKRFRVREIAYDPWHFEDAAERMQRAGLPMVEFPQNDSRMQPASQKLYDTITTREIRHDGDREFRQHLENASAKQTPRGGWRIVKPVTPTGQDVARRKVDAAVALAMANDRALFYSRPKKPRPRFIQL